MNKALIPTALYMNGGVKLDPDLVFSENLSALLERFPKVGFLLTLEPIVPREQKHVSVQWVAKLPLDVIELLYVVGWDLTAYHALKPWLAQEMSHEVVFLEESTEGALAWLHAPGALEAVSDPQVHLALLPQKGPERHQMLRSFARRYPVARLDIACSPLNPLHRKRAFYRLRLELLRLTTLSHALHLDRLHSDRLFCNWLTNLPQLPHSFYANRLKDRFKNIPAIICGAGPSLEASKELLKQAETKALVIAGGSTLAALSAQGIAPHFGMAIDPNFEEYLRFHNTLIQEIPLLFSTRVFPDIFHTWNGPTGYVRAGIGGVPEIWMEEALGLFEPLIGGGSLSEESISVTSICLAWAQFLGCNPIFLNGIDLAYTEKKRYAVGVEDNHSPVERGGVYSAADRFITRKNRKGHSVHSAVRWVMEGASFSHFAKQYSEVQFFNTTDGGLSLPAIPDMPLAIAMERFCSQEYDLRGQICAAVTSAAMPEKTASVIADRVKQLTESLERVIQHIEVILMDLEARILCPDRGQSGRAVLAEMELKEEDAYLFLFYDLFSVLDNVMQREWRREGNQEKRGRAKWAFFLDIAHRYLGTLHEWTSMHSKCILVHKR